jgi:glutamate-1-semialdehyde 2,1-aminomutase
MPFRRFFDRGSKEAPPDATTDVDSDVDSDVDAQADDVGDGDADAFDVEVVEAEEEGAADWRARARGVLPTGASTGSKRPEVLYGSADATGPTHFAQAVGCRVIDASGNELIDCTMALGAVALGYAEPNVTRAVIDVISTGHVSGLSSVYEVDVAERLCGVIPCADKVQFLKSGAEAMAAAVRIARTYTSRDLVIACGYFGWSDWCSDAAGVPEGTRRAIRRVAFDDVPALEAAVTDAGAQLAAIVIEPVIERLPSIEWIRRARELATAAGAVLVFDEIKTGFRLRTGGYQAYAEVVPDLAAFGKAMANGYPLAAVVGDRDVMDAARNTWISSTLASEGASLAAAAAVLSWHDSADICESLWAIGADLRRAVNSAIEASGIAGVTVDGLDPMWMLRFDRPERERRFLELAVDHGVLFKRGAYNYAALAHDDEAIRLIEGAASAALVDLRDEEADA